MRLGGVAARRRPMQHLETIRRLRQTIVDTFRPILGEGSAFALVDFPDSANAGDHAIWLGEKALLESLDITPVYAR